MKVWFWLWLWAIAIALASGARQPVVVEREIVRVDTVYVEESEGSGVPSAQVCHMKLPLTTMGGGYVYKGYGIDSSDALWFGFQDTLWVGGER